MNVDTSVCNSLTNCEHNALAITGNGNYVNLLKLFVKSQQVNLFLAGFTTFSPLCTGWLQPRFHSLYRVLSALTVITIFVGYKPSKRSFGISIFVETLIASNPTGRIFVFERCARESTLKYAGCARGLFFREKNACDGGKIQYPKKIY